MTSRRDFTRTLAALAASLPVVPFPVPSLSPLRRIGVQLYTVRESMREDVARTLARVRSIGYREVEFAGYFGLTPSGIRAALGASGLAAPAGHVGLEALGTGLTETLDAAEEIGHRWVVLPWIDARDRTPDGYDRIADQLNGAGEIAARRGIGLGYHNHDFDLHPWPDGTIPLERLIRRLDPRLVDVELDLYWVVKGGSDPLLWFDRFPGRFPMVHLKDAGLPPDHRMADLGAGVLEWRRILAPRARAGIRHYFIEHDSPAEPWSSITAGFRYLDRLGL